MNITINTPPHTIKGATVNSNRKVYVERGLVYDFATNTHVQGFNIQVGTSSLAVTDAQINTIMLCVNGDFYEEDAAMRREEVMRQHPSYRGFHDE